ncbi:MAG: hypothetical protein GXO12_03595 [Epsilonproteobacteria bacterium]|nr:hypothetical protein [Campylobacterota bacterium]
MKRFFVVFLVLPIILFVAYLLLFDSSYKKALEARFYYTMGEYQKAYTLAREVYLKNSYNTMALTIMTQSEIALSYKKYIQEAKR